MYILTDGKNYVMDDPIHPGRVMYSTSPVNAKKFTFKQARALLNNKSKKLSWIRSFNMVDDSSGEKIAEQEVRSRSNKGVFVGKNDIDFDVSILDQIMQETNNLLGIKIPTGIRCGMNTNWVLMIYPRSGLGFKYQLSICNTIPVVDADYYFSNNEGHIFVKLVNRGDKLVHINLGDAFAQGIFMEYGITEDDRVETFRNGGVGSTDKNK